MSGQMSFGNAAEASSRAREACQKKRVEIVASLFSLSDSLPAKINPSLKARSPWRKKLCQGKSAFTEIYSDQEKKNQGSARTS